MISLLVVGPPFSTSSSSIIVIHKFSNLDMILRSYQIGNPLKHFGNGICAWLVTLPSTIKNQNAGAQEIFHGFPLARLAWKWRDSLVAALIHLIRRLCDLWLIMCLQPSHAHFCGRIVNHCSVERVGFRHLILHQVYNSIQQLHDVLYLVFVYLDAF